MKELVKVETTEIMSAEKFGDAIIAEFIASRHASENTAKTYRVGIRALLKFFAANKITQPAESDVDNFVTAIKSSKSASTARLYTTTCKLFFSFLSRRGYYRDVAADVQLRLPKSQTHSKRALSAVQAQKLLASVRGDDSLSRRNRAIIALCLCCGLRTCEVSRINVGDFSSNFALLNVRGKGGKVAAVKIPRQVISILSSYLDVRGNVDGDSPLFVSASNQNRGVRLSVQSVQLVIKKYMTAAGVYEKFTVTCHSTRHFAATQALRNGVGIREVSQMLRHTSLTTTLVYLHDISLETRRAESSVADSLFGNAA